MADDILSIYAQSQPDKPAVIDDKPDGTVVAWTYAELEAQANRIGNLLLSLGISPGKKVLWCGPNSPQVVAIMSAARKIGAVAVPLNYRLTPEEALYVINHSDAEVACVDYERAYVRRAAGSAGDGPAHYRGRRPGPEYFGRDADRR
jgi:fatty-acyl-CoA synthase/long-chain acyl-CoA synthetase